MSKVDQWLTGIDRIYRVAAVILFILGLVAVYAMNAPKDSYTYTSTLGFLVTIPGESFNPIGFIFGFFIWGVIVFVAYLIIFFITSYIVNGFRRR
ncbi:MAG TPA: hypothetical protein PLZ58_02905 [Candidatus Saccharibacteria bacterium]|nr:hypothetical protein [Candidatus Saccharibacteria bacterium]HRQ06720.1 hypothetical protein [Candidatus Saccharibacteria bacterium]